jgi:hypothetical protein
MNELLERSVWEERGANRRRAGEEGRGEAEGRDDAGGEEEWLAIDPNIGLGKQTGRRE